MGLPIVIPAIAKGAAALSAALGLSAIAAASKEEHEPYGDLSLPQPLTDVLTRAFTPYDPEEVAEELMARAKIQQPTTTNIPTAENALVLKPEYRTVTTPTEFVGYEPLWKKNAGSSNSKKHSRTTSGTTGNGIKPTKPENKDKDKKEKSAFNRGWNKQGLPKKLENPTVGQQWKRVGQNIGYGIGRTGRFVLSPSFVLPTGIFGGATLGSYIATRKNNNDLSNQIDTVATRKNNSDKIYIAEIAE